MEWFYNHESGWDEDVGGGGVKGGVGAARSILVHLYIKKAYQGSILLWKLQRRCVYD